MKASEHSQLEQRLIVRLQVEAVCSSDKSSLWYIKYIQVRFIPKPNPIPAARVVLRAMWCQMLGFCRWKQYRLKEVGSAWIYDLE